MGWMNLPAKVKHLIIAAAIAVPILVAVGVLVPLVIIPAVKKSKQFACPKGKTMRHYDDNPKYNIYCYDKGSGGPGCRIPTDTTLSGAFAGKEKLIGVNHMVGPLCK